MMDFPADKKLKRFLSSCILKQNEIKIIESFTLKVNWLVNYETQMICILHYPYIIIIFSHGGLIIL